MSVKQKRFRMFALVLAVVCTLSMLAGCNVVTKNDPVVLKVGEVEMRLSDYTSIYNSYYSYYSEYQMYDVSTQEKLYEFQDFVYDKLVESAVIVYQAGQNGITLTEEELAEAGKNADSEMDSMLLSYTSYVYSTTNITDQNEAEKEARRLLVQDAASSGYGSYEAFRNYIFESIKRTELINKQTEAVKGTVTVSDAQVKELYDKEMAADKASYASAPAQYYTDWFFYNGYNEGIMPLYTPAGYVKVKRIFLGQADDAKVQEVADALKAGDKTFDELITEYSNDKTGTLYLVSESCGDQYADGFAEAALALTEVGQVSEAVHASDGVYFLYLAEILEEGPAALEGDVKEHLHTYLLNKYQEELFEKTVAEWVAAADVKEYRQRIRSVGLGS